VVGSAGVACLDSSSEEIFDIIEDQGCMVDGIYLYSKELFAHGPSQALTKVVDVELNIHRMSLLDVYCSCRSDREVDYESRVVIQYDVQEQVRFLPNVKMSSSVL